MIDVPDILSILTEEERTNLLAAAKAKIEEKSLYLWISVDSLGIDQSYQRSTGAHKVKAIAASFDRHAAGAILVSMRGDGSLFVIDGQHRLEAMKKLGLATAECRIAQGLTVQEEAVLYVKCNQVRKSPEALDVFRAELVAGDATATIISNTVEECGLSIQFRPSGNRRQGTIWAVVALKTIYKRGGAALLKEVLLLAKRAWPDEPRVFEASILLGITAFHLEWKGQYSREDFIAKMSTVDLSSILRRAQYHHEMGGKADYKAVADSLLDAYNSGKRTRRLVRKSAPPEIKG